MTTTNTHDGSAQGLAAPGQVFTITPDSEARTLKEYLQVLVTGMRPRGYAQAQFIFKKQFIVSVLICNKGNQCKAARELGMHRNTLERTCRLLHIDTGYIRRLCREYHLEVVQKKCAVIPFGAAQ